MSKIFLTVACLLIAIGTCNAQSDLVFYDADGDRVGTILGFSPASQLLSVYTSDGFLLSTHPRTGGIGNFAPLYYSNASCEGQAYVAHMGGTATKSENRWTSRGGELFLASDGEQTGIYARLDWAPTRFAGDELFVNGECWRLDSCGQAAMDCRDFSVSQEVDLFYPATIIENANYGIKDLGNGEFGFRPPLVPRVEKSNIMFCNGFESCPAK